MPVKDKTSAARAFLNDEGEAMPERDWEAIGRAFMNRDTPDDPAGRLSRLMYDDFEQADNDIGVIVRGHCRLCGRVHRWIPRDIRPVYEPCGVCEYFTCPEDPQHHPACPHIHTPPKPIRECGALWRGF